MRGNVNNMRHLLVYLCVFLAGSASAAPPNHTLWNQLLQKNVISLKTGISTSVNYKGMAQSREDLLGYLKRLSSVTKVEFERWDSAVQLAFLINAYNAWTIELVLTKYPNLQSIKDLGGFFTSPWRKNFIPMFGKNVSLDYIERQLIFGKNGYSNPRVHFALNCASKGCPTLRKEAYTGAKLERQLENQAQLFLSDFSRNRFNGKELEVSSIFKWYRSHFEGGEMGFHSLHDFLVLYADNLSVPKEHVSQLTSKKMDIKFLEYDWRLNGS